MKSILLIALAVGATLPAEARADPMEKSGSAASDRDDRAGILVRKGIDAYKKRDYATAREAFLGAYELDVLVSTGPMLADVEMKLKRYRDAAEHWSAYLKRLPPDRTAERTEISSQLEICRKHVALVKVVLVPSDAQLFVDGLLRSPKLVGSELWVEPGTYSLRAGIGERSSPTKEVTMRAGDTWSVVLEVPAPAQEAKPTQLPEKPKAEPVAKPVVDPPPPLPSRSSSTKTAVALTGGILTVAAGVVSFVYWRKREGAYDDAEAARSQAAAASTPSAVKAGSFCSGTDRPDACETLHLKLNEADRAHDVSLYAGVAAGVLGVATITTYLLWPKAKPRSSATAWIITPVLAPSGQGVTALVPF